MTHDPLTHCLFWYGYATVISMTWYAYNEYTYMFYISVNAEEASEGSLLTFSKSDTGKVI